MEVLLQIWGGSFYLINKICFSVSEGKDTEAGRRVRGLGWSVYILGVPAWVMLLIGNQNYIAASVEAGGLPAMFLGLYITCHRGVKPRKVVYNIVTFLTYLALTVGVINSLYFHGGLNSISQIFEIGVTFGFLLSGYYIANQNPAGWLFFMLGNVSMAALMYIEDATILMLQQLISLLFVIYGYKKSSRRD